MSGRPLWLQHEKYSSQLQMSLKVPEGRKVELEEQARGERLSTTKTGQQGALAKHTDKQRPESERQSVTSAAAPCPVMSSRLVCFRGPGVSAHAPLRPALLVGRGGLWEQDSL